MNTVSLYYTATAAQKMTFKYLFDRGTMRQNRKDEAKTATGLKQIKFT